MIIIKEAMVFGQGCRIHISTTPFRDNKGGTHKSAELCTAAACQPWIDLASRSAHRICVAKCDGICMSTEGGLDHLIWSPGFNPGCAAYKASTQQQASNKSAGITIGKVQDSAVWYHILNLITNLSDQGTPGPEYITTAGFT